MSNTKVMVNSRTYLIKFSIWVHPALEEVIEASDKILDAKIFR